LGLLAVGAGLQVRAALAQKRPLVLATALKLLVLPVLTWLISSLVGLNDRETGVLVLFSALPGAPASYVLARQLGGDAQLMAAILTAQTALSLLTLPLILLCFA
jgi:predicted permease